jgi:hypothetical protein
MELPSNVPPAPWLIAAAMGIVSIPVGFAIQQLVQRYVGHRVFSSVLLALGALTVMTSFRWYSASGALVAIALWIGAAIGSAIAAPRPAPPSAQTMALGIVAMLGASLALYGAVHPAHLHTMFPASVAVGGALGIVCGTLLMRNARWVGAAMAIVGALLTISAWPVANKLGLHALLLEATVATIVWTVLALLFFRTKPM